MSSAIASRPLQGPPAARRQLSIQMVEQALRDLGSGWHAPSVVTQRSGRSGPAVASALASLKQQGRAIHNGVRVAGSRWTAGDGNGSPLHEGTPWPWTDEVTVTRGAGPVSRDRVVGALDDLGAGWFMSSEVAAAAQVSQRTARDRLSELAAAGGVVHNGMAGLFSRWTAGRDGLPAHPDTPWPPPEPASRAEHAVAAEDMKAKETRLGISDERLLAQVAAGCRCPAAIARHLRISDALRVEWALDRLVAAGQLVRRPNPVRGYGEPGYVFEIRAVA